MAEIAVQAETSAPRAPSAPSPPPNCAICLGNCINKCFSDSCMHQFCFKCLLEWSKVKAVCPLCKQPFTSIIHNVKSNDEYEQHFIGPEPNNIQDDDFDEHFIVRSTSERRNSYGYYLPTGPPPSRHFQFRTTFTVDPRGELAIQQLLSSHPLTNSFYEYMSSSSPGFNGFHTRHTSGRRRYRDVSSTSYRRYIYSDDLWVHTSADLSGRFREISPQFYRENPTARNRLVPWLNRELNALLFDHTQHVMDVVDLILSHLDRHHIMSRYFKQILVEHLANRTDHFIHELYNFMRSPFDMIGYDHHIFYTPGVPPPQFSINLTADDDESSDSDVAIVPVERTATTDPVVINYSDSSRDSDVIISEPTPPVVVIDLVDSDSSGTEVQTINHKPMLPLKIRLKRKRQSRENKSKRKAIYTSTSESDSSGSGNSSDSYFSKYRSKHKYKKSKYYIIKDTESDSTDNEPILNRLKKEREDRKRKKVKKSDKKKKQKKHREASKNGPAFSEPKFSPEPVMKHESDSDSFNVPLSTLTCHKSAHLIPPISPKVEDDMLLINAKIEVTQEEDTPGPSGNLLIKNELTNSWFARPMLYSSEDNSD